MSNQAANRDLLDQAGEIREGEELDVQRLKEHLRPVLGERVASLQIRQFPGGFSNLTYLLGCGNDKWVLRRPPFGSKVKSAHDMSRACSATAPVPYISVTIILFWAVISI